MLQSSWMIQGQIVSLRDPKTKAGAVFAHMVRIASLGNMFDVRLDDTYTTPTLVVGNCYELTGAFEPRFDGRLALIAKAAKPVKEA